MKKKILVGLLALALPLTACDFSLESLKFWEKDKEKQQENQGGDENNHDETPSRTNLVIEEYVADICGKNSFTEEQKAYFVSRALELDAKGVDTLKIEKYVEEFPLLEDETKAIFDVANYFETIQKEGYLDDCAYFVTALGKSILYVAKDEEGIETEYVQALLTTIENEGDNLANNIYGLANTAINVYSLASNPAFLLDCAEIVDSNGKIVSSKLKNVVKSGSEILEKFVEAKTNVVYFVNLAKKLTKSLTDVAKPKETDHFSVAMFNVIDRVLQLDLGSAVGTVFDFVSEFAAKAKTLDASYYEQIEALDNPIEADSYAAYGFLEHVAEDLTINLDEVSKAVGDSVDLIKEIYGYLKEEIGEVPAFVQTIINSVNTKTTLLKAVKLVVDILNTRLDSLNALSFAKIFCRLFLEATNVSIIQSHCVQSWDEVDERIKELVDYSNVQSELADYGSYDFSQYGEVVVDDNGNVSCWYYSLFVVRYHHGEGEQDYHDDFHFVVYEKSLENLDEIGSLIYALLVEIADSNLPVSIIKDLLELVSPAYDLFDEIKDEFEIDEETLNTIELIVNLLEENNELVEKTIEDLFAFAKNLASAFVDVDGKEAEVDLTTFIFQAMLEGFDPSMLQISEDKLEGLVPLLEDAYNILDKAGLLEDVLSLVALLGGVDTVETMDQFTEIVYGFITSMFVVEAE